MNKTWMQREMPATMRELCIATGYFPLKDSISVRYNLYLRVGALSEIVWHEELGLQAQLWYNSAVQAVERGDPLPGFTLDAEKYQPKPPPKVSKLSVLARLMCRMPDASWVEFQDACLMEGVVWRKEGWPRVQKSVLRTLLKVLMEEDCLNEKGKSVFNGKFIGGNNVKS